VQTLMDKYEKFDRGPEELIISTPLRISRTSIAALDADPFVELFANSFSTWLEFRYIWANEEAIAGRQAVPAEQDADLRPKVAIAKP